MGQCMKFNQKELGWGPDTAGVSWEFYHSLHWWTSQALPFKNQDLRPCFTAKVQLNGTGETIPEHSQHSDPYICNSSEKAERNSQDDGGLGSHSTHRVVAVWDLTAGTVNMQKSIPLQGTSLSPWDL